MYRVGFTSPHPSASKELNLLFSGLLALGFVWLAVPKTRIEILSSKGFKSMDLSESVTFSCGRRELSSTPT